MSTISELVAKLRRYSQQAYNNHDNYISEDLKEAADLIEELSAKLAAANMERSSQYYNGGWIPCSVAVPINKLSGICDDIYIKRESGEVVQGCYWTGKQYWWGLVGGKWTKIDDATTWKPFSLTEPYKGVE